MASSGPLSPGTLADDSGVGTQTWNNTGNAGASDDSYADVSLLFGQTSHYLKATNFGFAIPSGATIDGIVVAIEKSATVGSSVVDSQVRIVKGGTIGATDKASGTNWPTTDAYSTYGSSSDLWGETWTHTDINASTFGAALSAAWVANTPTANVDHIRITVHYTDPATGSSSSSSRLLTTLGVG